LAITLMDTSTDKDPDVQEQIYSSLCFMGETAMVEVLESCDSYLRQNKLSTTHRTIILRAMETIVRENLSKLNKDTAKMVILLASNEMTKSKGLAVAFGICSAHHLDDTLEKLSEFLKSDIMKKHVNFFNLFKDRADGDLEKIKSALILCYGYVAVYAPTELVLPRIESDILRNVFLYFHTKVLGIKVEPKVQCSSLPANLLSSLCSAIHYARKIRAERGPRGRAVGGGYITWWGQMRC
ncbi:hypothetical protein AB205_0055300, partial [Aquarana catesbeiana]